MATLSDKLSGLPQDHTDLPADDRKILNALFSKQTAPPATSWTSRLRGNVSARDVGRAAVHDLRISTVIGLVFFVVSLPAVDRLLLRVLPTADGGSRRIIKALAMMAISWLMYTADTVAVLSTQAPATSPGTRNVAGHTAPPHTSHRHAAGATTSTATQNIIKDIAAMMMGPPSVAQSMFEEERMAARVQQSQPPTQRRHSPPVAIDDASAIMTMSAAAGGDARHRDRPMTVMDDDDDAEQDDDIPV
jgi:CBS domain-containing protein